MLFFRTIISLTAFLFVISFLVGGCSKNNDAFSFPSQPAANRPVPLSNIPSSVSSVASELLTDEKGAQTLAVKLYGFELAFVQGDEFLSIRNVTSGSIASLAEFTPFDRVSEINGKTVMRFSGENFKDLRDIFTFTKRVDLTLSSGGRVKHIALLPPLMFEKKGLPAPYRAFYIAADTPYRSDLIVMDAQESVVSTFSFLSAYASLPDVEQYTPQIFNEESFSDLTQDGIPELKMELQKKEGLERQIVWLVWEKDHFAPLVVFDAAGAKKLAIFPHRINEKNKTSGVIFELMDFQKDGRSEMVAWRFQRKQEETESITVEVSAEVYRLDENGVFRYDKVLSGQFRRIQTIALMSEDAP